MKFDPEMQHNIQAKKLFKRRFLIKMFYGLFAMSLTVLFRIAHMRFFFNFAYNISNYESLMCITQT